MKLGNPKNTIEVIQKYDFDFQKKFGQNFLIDERVLEKIISAAEVNKEDFVLEIGPGIGTMTQYLAENAREVMAVEIDKNLIPILSDTLSAYDNVSILNADILKVDIAKIVEEKNGGKPVKVVANLPYYITTPIIMGLFESHVPIDSITVMVQKEVADRMQSGPGTKDYGALSLAVQYYAEPYVVANVPPNCFMPRPKVGSAVIRLTKYKDAPIKVTNENDICVCQLSITFPFFQHFHIHLTVVITAAFFQTVCFHQLHLNIIMRPVFIFCKYVHANTLTFRIEKETMFCADLNSFNLDLQHTFQETSAVFCIHHNSCKHKIVMKYQFFQCFFTHFIPPYYRGILYW